MGKPLGETAAINFRYLIPFCYKLRELRLWPFTLVAFLVFAMTVDVYVKDYTFAALFAGGIVLICAEEITCAIRDKW